MADLEQRIIEFIVERARIERDLIELDSALLQDFGMDGDDAAEFLLKFADDFHVDLTALKPHWHEHFKSEGCLFLPPKGCMVVTGSAVIGGFLVHLAFNSIPAWAAIIGLILLIGWICRKVFNYYEHEEKAPITVKDLVDAATSGRWVMQYERPEPKNT